MDGIRRLFAGLEVSASGLAAQRRRLDTVAENLANASTTRTAEGGPYRRKTVQFSEVQSRAVAEAGLPGVQNQLNLTLTRSGHLMGQEYEGATEGGVSAVRAHLEEDPSPPQAVYDPGHPDADAEGFVLYPNVNIVVEMAQMISATRAYEANATAVKVFKDIVQKALDIGKA